MPKKPPPAILAVMQAKLGHLPGYTAKAMFGGYGLYVGGQIFAVADGERVYFRINPETAADYEAAGSKPFEYAPGMFLKTYYDLPKIVLDDDVLIVEWAMRSADRSNDKLKTKKPKKKVSTAKGK